MGVVRICHTFDRCMAYKNNLADFWMEDSFGFMAAHTMLPNVMNGNSEEETITLSPGQLLDYTSFTPEYTEEEMLLRRAEHDTGKATRGDTAAIGLTRTPASGMNRLQQWCRWPNNAIHTIVCSAMNGIFC